MSPKRFDIDRAWLAELYLEKRWSMARIGAHFGCDRATVRAGIDRLGIPRRQRSGSAISFDRDELYELYVNQRLPIENMAQRYYCHPMTVRRTLKRLHIPARQRLTRAIELDRTELHTLYIDQQWSLARIGDKYACSTRTVARALDRFNIPRRRLTRRSPIPLDELRDLYVRQRYNLRRCAQHFGRHHRYIRTTLIRYDIPVRARGSNQYSTYWHEQ